MLVKTGLLVVSNPKHIGKVLTSIKEHVNNTLYIQLLSALSEPFGTFHPNVFDSWPKFSKTITGIYSLAARHCTNLDVRILLSGLKYKTVSKIETKRPIDVVIFDKIHSQDDINTFIGNRVSNVTNNCSFVTLDTGIVDEKFDVDRNEGKVYKHTVFGGTFDRLHVAHKVLLSEISLRSEKKVTVGVTEENILQNKTLCELVQPIDVRIKHVKDFLEDINSELDIDVVPIKDPYGPTAHDPSMEMLIVSEETLRGGNKVNDVRKENGLSNLTILKVNLLDEPYPLNNEEIKISSSTSRMRLLGTLLNPVKPNVEIPRKPYVIGLTGGIASGKSNVAKRLFELGAHVIDCDKVGHQVYEPGKRCFSLLVDAFGQNIISPEGYIDRKILGGIVFNDPSKLERLNSLVWPAIAEEVRNLIEKCSSKVVVVEAAVLLKADWQRFCHEVWTTIIPHSETINRLRTRNGLDEQQAKARVMNQPSNKFYVDLSNVVICSLWEYEYTRQQIDTAWNLLQSRIET